MRPVDEAVPVAFVGEPTESSAASSGGSPLPPSHADQPDQPDAGSLIERVNAGDRDAASKFLVQFGEIIRRRVRGKMGRGMRRLFDSQEILSTVGRRLDRYVRDAAVRPDDTPQFWALVFKMVDAALVDKVRVYKRLQGIEGEDSEFARRALSHIRESDQHGPEHAELEIDAAFRCLKNDVDRELLAMWLNEVPFPQIASLLNISPDAARKRWQTIRAHLRSEWLKDGPA